MITYVFFVFSFVVMTFEIVHSCVPIHNVNNLHIDTVNMLTKFVALVPQCHQQQLLHEKRDPNSSNELKTRHPSGCMSN